MDLFLTMTDSDFDDKSKQVANLLCKAAGIFEFLRGEAGKWLVKPDPLFTELKDDTLVALARFERGEGRGERGEGRGGRWERRERREERGERREERGERREERGERREERGEG